MNIRRQMEKTKKMVFVKCRKWGCKLKMISIHYDKNKKIAPVTLGNKSQFIKLNSHLDTQL